MKRIAVLVSGRGSNLQALIDCDPVRPHLALVLSNKSDAYALNRAEKAGLDRSVITRYEASDRERYDRLVADFLNKHDIDLVVLAGWMHIFGAQYLDRFQGETINLHPALPGQYPGLNAIERAYKNGAAESGCMVHRVTLEVDAGEVLGTQRVVRLSDDSLDDFTTRMHRAEHELLVEVVKELILPRIGNKPS